MWKKLTKENKPKSVKTTHTENPYSYISVISDDLVKSKNETVEAVRKLDL